MKTCFLNCNLSLMAKIWQGLLRYIIDNPLSQIVSIVRINNRVVKEEALEPWFLNLCNLRTPSLTTFFMQTSSQPFYVFFLTHGQYVIIYFLVLFIVFLNCLQPVFIFSWTSGNGYAHPQVSVDHSLIIFSQKISLFKVVIFILIVTCPILHIAYKCVLFNYIQKEKEQILKPTLVS